MKILITTDTFSPMINGVVTSVKNLYKELKSSGHEVKILTLSHTRKEAIKGDVYYVKSIPIGVYPDAKIKFPFYNKLINEIIEWGPDIIHSQTEFSMMLVSRHIAKKLNIPQIHTYHTLYENYLDYLWGGKILSKSMSIKITKKMLNNLDGVIAATNKTKNTLLSYGVSKPTYVVPTGIELSKFQRDLSADDKQALIQELQLSQDDRILVYVGRIAEEKNISEILTLLPDVINICDQVKLLIVGGGPYLTHLQDQVKKQHLENHVIFTGMIPSDEVYKYYKMGEIFVNASTSETQGLTYLEALSSGCPVVCKYDPCLDGVIEQGDNGYSYKEQGEFARYIHEILSNVSLRHNMSHQAILKAKEYSSGIFASGVLDKYRTIIQANQETPVSLVQFGNPTAQEREV